MRKEKELREIRKMMEKTGMLEIYAEQVHDGVITVEEGLRRSFVQVRKFGREGGANLQKADLPARSGLFERGGGVKTPQKILADFQLLPEEAQIVKDAIAKALAGLAAGTRDRNRALAEICKAYLGLEHNGG